MVTLPAFQWLFMIIKLNLNTKSILIWKGSKALQPSSIWLGDAQCLGVSFNPLKPKYTRFLVSCHVLVTLIYENTSWKVSLIPCLSTGLNKLVINYLILEANGCDDKSPSTKQGLYCTHRFNQGLSLCFTVCVSVCRKISLLRLMRANDCWLSGVLALPWRWHRTGGSTVHTEHRVGDGLRHPVQSCHTPHTYPGNTRAPVRETHTHTHLLATLEHQPETHTHTYSTSKDCQQTRQDF